MSHTLSRILLESIIEQQREAIGTQECDRYYSQIDYTKFTMEGVSVRSTNPNTYQGDVSYQDDHNINTVINTTGGDGSVIWQTMNIVNLPGSLVADVTDESQMTNIWTMYRLNDGVYSPSMHYTTDGNEVNRVDGWVDKFMRDYGFIVDGTCYTHAISYPDGKTYIIFEDKGDLSNTFLTGNVYFKTIE